MYRLLILFPVLAFSVAAIADNDVFVDGTLLESNGTVEQIGESVRSADVEDFIRSGSVNITEIRIQDTSTFATVTNLLKGRTYKFIVSYSPKLCKGYYNELGFFTKNGSMVYYIDDKDPGPEDCSSGYSSLSYQIQVPPGAPSGDYTWGARTTLSGGQDVEYPANFRIQ